MIGVALIGFGYWGPNLARNFTQNEDFKLIEIVDKSVERQELASKLHPDAHVDGDLDVALRNPKVGLVAIATPASTHYALARAAIEMGKSVLVEKPIAVSLSDAKELLSLAKSKNKEIFVDHTFLFSPQVRHIKNLLDSNQLGDLFFIQSSRINLGKIQTDCSVTLDLLTHDISILKYLLGTAPEIHSVLSDVQAPSFYPSTAFVSLVYPKNILVQLSASWMSPVKIRQFVIVGSKKTVVYDDTNSSEKIKIFESNLAISQDPIKSQINYRTGNVEIPHIEEIEPLKIEISELSKHFKGEKEFLSSGVFALEVLDIVNKIDEFEVRVDKK